MAKVLAADVTLVLAVNVGVKELLMICPCGVALNVVAVEVLERTDDPPQLNPTLPVDP